MSKITGNGYEMVAQGKSVEILMYGTVGMPSRSGAGMTAQEFATQLNQIGDVDEINLRFNSKGGSIIDGTAIFNTLNRHPAKISGIVDGLCGSIMTIVAMACDTLLMSEGSFMFIHEGHAMFDPDEMFSADDLRKIVADLEPKTAEMRDIYSRKTGLPRQKIADMMKAETWMNSTDAVEMRFATGVMKQRARRAACCDPHYYAKAPAEAKMLFEPEPVAEKKPNFGMAAKAKLFKMRAGLSAKVG